jgi:26S proteasome regulatory subunit N1
MTSVPKPFKFLKDHYTTLKEYYEKLCIYLILVTSDFQKSFADFLSVLAMVFDENGKSLELLLHGTR